MILSRDAEEEAFDKIWHPCQIQTLQSTGIEGTSLSIFKAIYEKPAANSHSQWRNTGSLSLKTRHEMGMSTLTAAILNRVRDVMASAIRQWKEIKGIQIIKEEVKLPLRRWHDTVPRKPKRLHPKTAGTPTASLAVWRDTNSGPRNQWPFCTQTMRPRKGTSRKGSIPFIQLQHPKKSMSYLGRNLTKGVKDLYLKHCRTCLKQTEKDTKRWKKVPCSWVGRIYIGENVNVIQGNLHN